MSDTPRTDEHSMITLDTPDGIEIIYADFARQLERELAEARELLSDCIKDLSHDEATEVLEKTKHFLEHQKQK